MYRKRTEIVKDITLRDGSPREKQVIVVTCCGEDIWCEEFTNTCVTCGSDYNFAGQHLAPRSQWGEETGEHWSECI